MEGFLVPKYNVDIKGTVDGDDADLAYLNKGKPRFETAEDVREYLAEFMAEELAFETTEIKVVPSEGGSARKSPGLKVLK